jgi:dextranase
MKTWRLTVLLVFVLYWIGLAFAQAPKSLKVADVYTDKSRYAPGEQVGVLVDVSNAEDTAAKPATLRVSFWHLQERVGVELSKSIVVPARSSKEITFSWVPPVQDFTGYFVDVRLIGPDGKEMDRSQTAVDVSSDWKRFPRYGYLAQYSKTTGAKPEEWISELNKFHIDGLEYYDFQNRHEKPLAGSVEHPSSHWQDIAGRDIDASILKAFLSAAHQRNMMNMAYNSSYSAYASAFTDGEDIKLQWAIWDTANGPRTLQTAKALDLDVSSAWKTRRLIYMNQNSQEWQNYIFGQMADLFRVYPFDGWHIDTFGTRGGYAHDGAYVNFISGFPGFVDRASEVLHKRMVLNTVNTEGQARMAHSAADFVYSELWDDHETYASIFNAASQVHTDNPAEGVVFAAYLHRRDENEEQRAHPKIVKFNMPSVLLADADIFASGASHIELGDGNRMLSSEYFPADIAYFVSPELHTALRHYYDFLTAYENVLRYQVTPAAAVAVAGGYPSSPNGVPNTIWTIARQKGDVTIVHLLNLLGSNDAHWRDIDVDRPDAPLISGVKVRVFCGAKISSAEWASPDVDGGRLHALSFETGNEKGRSYVDIVVPSLKYWDMVLLHNIVAE